MNFLNKTLCAAGLVASLGSAQAAVINNWFLNPGSGGLAAATKISEYLDINGNAFIDINPTGGGNFSFTEYSVFNSIQHDSTGIGYGFGNNLTATFAGSGVGTFGGGFIFTSGTLTVYDNSRVPGDPSGGYGSTVGIYGADQGTKIGTFKVLTGGGGNVDASGSPTGNGQITVNLQALAPNSLVPGHFFSPTGADLSATDVLAFSFTNANTIGTPTSTQVSEIVCQGAGFTASFCPSGVGYANVPGDYIFVSNNGQFKLATVPEPSSIALVGLAFVGASFARRRLAAKNA